MNRAPTTFIDRQVLLVLPLLGAIGVIVSLAGCGSLPKPTPAWNVPHSMNTNGLQWVHALAPGIAEHPGCSGVELLRNGMDALSARLALADSAERSLDIQYYMWKPDAAGLLLADRIVRAADRGVHVRLLLDDIGGSTSDAALLALDSHSNIEVRVFNPIANRVFRKISALLSFERITRRMHNKSFTADRTVTIVGGRNVETRYFAPGDEPMFADLDVLAAGPAAGEVALMFDKFWLSPRSIPIYALEGKSRPVEKRKADYARLANQAQSAASSSTFSAVDADTVAARIRRREPDLVWGDTHLVYDRPEKITADEDYPTNHLFTELRGMVNATTNQFLVVSPYFIPGRKGIEFFRSLRARGIRVVVLSNSLASTDVTAVHASYRRYRKDLLRAGVEMWEFRPDAPILTQAPGHGIPPPRGKKPPPTALHTKAFAFDRDALFVGSLNLDPRSAALNTEMGLVMRMPSVASAAADEFETNLDANAYHLEFIRSTGPCKECGSVVWHSDEGGVDVKYTHEPHTSIFERIYVCLLALLPIESQL